MDRRMLLWNNGLVDGQRDASKIDCRGSVKFRDSDL
jgi:hypothetical protein